jgi:hypothetical protein
MGVEPDYECVAHRADANSHLGGDLMVRKAEDDSLLKDGYWVTDEENETVMSFFWDSYGQALGYVEGVEAERGNYDRALPKKQW